MMSDETSHVHTNQSIIDYVASIESFGARKALLKHLVECIPKKECDVSTINPDIHRRLFLSCAEDIVQNDDKENFGVAIVALGDGTDWVPFSKCSFEVVKMTIARQTCLSLIYHDGYKALQKFLLILPYIWGEESRNTLISELKQVIQGFRSPYKQQNYEFSKSYVAKYNASCWVKIKAWFKYQRNQLFTPLLTTLISRDNEKNKQEGNNPLSEQSSNNSNRKKTHRSSNSKKRKKKNQRTSTTTTTAAKKKKKKKKGKHVNEVEVESKRKISAEKRYLNVQNEDECVSPSILRKHFYGCSFWNSYI